MVDYFQGSLDGKNWTNLRVHENDRTMCKPGQFASWPVSGASSLLPFRYFRVLLTGPTTADSNPWNFCICFLELYGYFRWDSKGYGHLGFCKKINSPYNVKYSDDGSTYPCTPSFVVFLYVIIRVSRLFLELYS